MAGTMEAAATLTVKEAIEAVEVSAESHPPWMASTGKQMATLEEYEEAVCNIPAQGLIGLIGYSYQQVATSFSQGHLQRTLKLNVLGLEKFKDG